MFLTAGTKVTQRSRALGIAASIAALALSGCGGGGGGGGSDSLSNAPPTNPTFMAGVFQPASSFANQCARPRTGIDPSTGRAYLDVQGSVVAENNYLRSEVNALYLWYRDVVDQDPAASSTTEEYFQKLKTTRTTAASGKPVDQFNFTIPTDEFNSFSESGQVVGYGAQFLVRAPRVPRDIVVAFVEPGSPAAAAGVKRGDKVLLVDGVDAVNVNTQAGVDTLNAGLFPSGSQAHVITLQDINTGVSRPVSLTPASIISQPVQNVKTVTTPGGMKIGYMQFNDHIATAELALINAVNTLKAQNINELVLDIRYNGGGLLDVANELSYMIAGPVPTAGKTFERLVFNDKNPSTNPVTGEALRPTLFRANAVGFSATRGTALPTLNLQRVFVLTTADTCSASESIINSLRGVDVDVVQIGGTTCGKPFGFYPDDNCGTTYFYIQFQGLNNKDFGDYPDGFTPQNFPGTSAGTRIKGCSVADDLTRNLGDPQEGMFSTAMSYVDSNGMCPPATFLAAAPANKTQSKLSANEDNGVGLMREPYREMRILRPDAE